MAANDNQPLYDPEHEASAAAQADRCRRLARSMYDRGTAEMLKQMADDYDRRPDPKNPRS